MQTEEDNKRLVAQGINRSSDFAKMLEHLLEMVVDYEEGKIISQANKLFFGDNEDYRESFLDLGYEPFFIDWLISDYRTDKGNYIIDIFIDSFRMFFEAAEIGMLEIIRDSVLSVYQLEKRGDCVFAEDMIRGGDYLIRNIEELKEYELGEFRAFRLIKCDGGFEIFGEEIIISSGDIDILLERNREEFEVYLSDHPDAEWEDFLKSSSILIYQYLNIEVDREVPYAPIEIKEVVNDAEPSCQSASEEEVRSAKSWCETPHADLGGRSPRESIADEVGRKRVANLLYQLEAISAEDPELGLQRTILLIRAELDFLH